MVSWQVAGSLLAQVRKNFASLVHTVFAAVAKASCRHGLEQFS